jgi:hypothetical protein
VPIDILCGDIKLMTQDQRDNLGAKTSEELDFIEYNQDNLGIGESKIKDQLPEMFLSHFSYREFEKRCNHHKVFLSEVNEEISEIEEILLKIVKIL